MHQQLNLLRQKIDRVDQKWLELLTERFTLTRQIGQIKAAENLPSVAPDRKAAIISKFQTQAQQLSISPELATDLITRIMQEVVKEHHEARTSPLSTQTP